ncbi:hypothetical protein PPYR_02126 [Photinus pyralis]|uniref:Uncharacterized protein n=1 Tax=Photinus pyralis TaxID=7054 RepID=A0A5N4B6G4_PHOPY|nr:hypothetical protein PPYR_02126 [Photinus pyralis]
MCSPLTQDSLGTMDDDLQQPATSKQEAAECQLQAATEAENYFLKQDLLETSKELHSLSERFCFEKIQDRAHLVLIQVFQQQRFF